MYIQRHLVVYSKITLKILYILRHLCVYPKPTIDLYIETRLPTPIYWAAKNGHTVIVQILAPLTDNPNAPDNQGKTPIAVAKNAEIRRILESFKTS